MPTQSGIWRSEHGLSSMDRYGVLNRADARVLSERLREQVPGIRFARRGFSAAYPDEKPGDEERRHALVLRDSLDQPEDSVVEIFRVADDWRPEWSEGPRGIKLQNPGYPVITFWRSVEVSRPRPFLAQARLSALFQRDDRGQRNLVRRTFRIAESIATGDALCVDEDTLKPIEPMHTRFLFGFESMKWCRADQERTLAHRWRPLDDCWATRLSQRDRAARSISAALPAPPAPRAVSRRETSQMVDELPAFSETLKAAIPDVRFLRMDGVPRPMIGSQTFAPRTQNHTLYYVDALSGAAAHDYLIWDEPPGWQPDWLGPFEDGTFVVANPPTSHVFMSWPRAAADRLILATLEAWPLRGDERHAAFVNTVFAIQKLYQRSSSRPSSRQVRVPT